MTTLSPAEVGPLWRRVAADLRDRLAAGEFEGFFPGEFALAEQYGVSRATVREALRELRAQGMVTAHRGRPSRPGIPVMIEQSTDTLFSLYSSVRAVGLDQRSAVRALDVRRDGAAAQRLGLDDGADLVYLERVRFVGVEPLAVDCTFLPAARTRPLLEADFTGTSLYGELRSRCGITVAAGSETVRAAIPDAEQREALAIGPDTAILLVERVGLADGEPIEYRQTALRGDRFTLTNRYPSAGSEQ